MSNDRTAQYINRWEYTFYHLLLSFRSCNCLFNVNIRQRNDIMLGCIQLQSVSERETSDELGACQPERDVRNEQFLKEIPA
jgi:hypothetical protein